MDLFIILSNSTISNSTENSDNTINDNNSSNVILILSLSFTLMILTYISIIKMYCTNKRENNDYDYDYEPLHNNYGTLEEF
jgi:hypothetical protein